MAKFINPFSDWGFKHIFGQEVLKGLKKGMAKGRVEENKSIALNLKRAGASIQMIATATGLSEAEIEALQ